MTAKQFQEIWKAMTFLEIRVVDKPDYINSHYKMKGMMKLLIIHNDN